jgi:hypothetical protein
MVLHRPVELAAVIGKVKFLVSDYATNQALTPRLPLSEVKSQRKRSVAIGLR